MRKQTTLVRGLTLIELLVTIAIMGIVIAIAVPVLRPPVDARACQRGCPHGQHVAGFGADQIDRDWPKLGRGIYRRSTL